MKTVSIVTAIVILAIGSGSALAAGKNTKKAHRWSPQQETYRSSDPQRNAATFDDTKYYERLSEKIPIGTSAWWRQRAFESGR